MDETQMRAQRLSGGKRSLEHRGIGIAAAGQNKNGLHGGPVLEVQGNPPPGFEAAL
jgi:hypothetical protein